MTPCKYCGGETVLRRKEFKVGGETRFHIGAYCFACNKFTLPWLKQKREHANIPAATDPADGVVPLFDLINPKLVQ